MTRPEALSRAITPCLSFDHQANRVMTAMLGMVKLDIEKLRNA